MLEKLIMLQILKTMAYSRSEDQRTMLDTILDGADKAARTVANIRSIKEGKEPPVLDPLAARENQQNTNEPIFERESMNIEQPVPPPKIPSSAIYTDPIESIYNDTNALRKKLDNYYDAGVLGKKEINELIIDVFTLQTKLFQVLKNK